MPVILILSDRERFLDLGRLALPDGEFCGPVSTEKGLDDLLRSLKRAPDLVWVASPGTRERAMAMQGALEAARTRLEHVPVLFTRSGEVGSEEGDLWGAVDGGQTYFLDDEALDAQGLRVWIEEVLAFQDVPEAEGPVFWGRDTRMCRLRRRIHVLARGRLPVVLLGPTGTGKSMLAREVIHPLSGQRGDLVAVDLATMPSDLMAAHLFGVARGAYTGAASDRAGAFERADGGTLFLDEIGNLSVDAQKMLLSVLQQGTVTRLGETRERTVRVKLVVATHEDLAQRVREGTFREDLYMRLNPAMAVVLPSLTDRAPDWRSLVEHTLLQVMNDPILKSEIAGYGDQHGLGVKNLRIYCGRRGPKVGSRRLTLWVPAPSMRILQRYAWPGNLREFAMVVENALWLALSEAQSATALVRPEVLVLRPGALRQMLEGYAPAPDTQSDLVHRVMVRAQSTLHEVATSCERQYFEQMYRETGGDFSRMAEQLLGDPNAGRKVQLRFNQLGLRVRDYRHLRTA